ncbi:hypothetical protein [Pseudoalteromonas luteoviolacea]|uniref:Uncharacterized protein n=1 Tax=Pseudoalteromonas luteoviolacea S4054 TaxID=1129367 RepID=A0A0F6ADR5_9GAMM|nr:hypothetical protein [Pseudoalteromonas luteoviolacea]AOT08373.1 hypothetical protein S4054249_11180 [Pseudoalteromonas luteoviolacea]AOT13289.1 hypothetical protein S40542_11155 [Pseudoalteromonas luteoviolacea]AOT18202.1 hypothetical protein S4054_11155 [Pseudoalteromonas luteoviolacea]KKE84320.1 hypothetical protein N479_10495 [Pseudoalteromonas luteoviolacea S4054]KZN76075.1 hypothetical protein N481_06920 [Pseudoalteromonas luteoviolacea S4047-1]
MIKSAILFLTLSFTLFANSANAYQSKQGYIKNIKTDNKYNFVTLNVCSENSSTDCKLFWIGSASDIDKAALSIAITAMVSKTLVWVGSEHESIANGAYRVSSIDLK